jgi:hypothetical protein
MARKRKPLVLGGMIVELDAPGLHLVRRSNGIVHQYWEASAQAVHSQNIIRLRTMSLGHYRIA